MEECTAMLIITMTKLITATYGNMPTYKLRLYSSESRMTEPAKMIMDPTLNMEFQKTDYLDSRLKLIRDRKYVQLTMNE